ncbi:MAG: ribosome biogenesis GTP-binding protein YihA/YsxC [Bacteroidota bacterium]
MQTISFPYFCSKSEISLILMGIKYANYIGSYTAESQCPKDGLPEYAFIGRSNVGKSSLINRLCGRKDLARVSKSPGKTQTLNFFQIDESWYIVDLPGYGYAKVSKKRRQNWERMIETYFVKRATLGCAIVLIDANLPPQAIDVEFINWLGQRFVPFVIVYTKTDRLRSQNKLEQNIKTIQGELLKYWNELPQQFITSSTKGEGVEELLDFIHSTNQQLLSK